MRKRNHAITVRLSDDEYNTLQKNVDASGHTQQSYIINSVLDNRISSREEIEEIKGIAKSLADMDIQLRGIGTNLNQMAHIANGQGVIPTAEKMVQIANEVSQIKREVDEEWLLTRQSISRPNHTGQ